MTDQLPTLAAPKPALWLLALEEEDGRAELVGRGVRPVVALELHRQRMQVLKT